MTPQRIKIGLLACTLLLTGLAGFAQTAAKNSADPTIHQQLTALLKKHRGRLGIYAIDTATHSSFSYHAQQRFPMCSTAKVMIAGALLKKSLTEPDLLNQQLKILPTEIKQAGYTPITGKHLHQALTLKALAHAAISYSDNLAANLLMKKLGGPNAITCFARSLDDHTFQLNRWEPHLNTAIPGDNRDTTTPKAMAETLRKMTLGPGLPRQEQAQLRQWLLKNTTGRTRIRAGLAKHWRIGDKTGTGDYGTTNDIAIIWPPGCKAIVMGIFYTQPKPNAKPNDAIIAKAARLVILHFAHSNTCLQQQLNAIQSNTSRH